jgi:hypothetical protein
MRRQLLLGASVAVLVAVAGCHHKCLKKDDCCGNPPPPIGMRGPATLPPPGVPTQPLPAVPGPAPSVFPGPSGYLPPTTDGSGPKVLFPDPLPGSSSSRPAQPYPPGVLGGPVKPTGTEPPKAMSIGTGLPGFTKVKDGLYAGRKPTIDGYDSLKHAAFRTVVYLHGAGADVAAVKDLASDRGLLLVAIETTPETLAEASKQFDRVVTDRQTRPAYVFADNDLRAGALWYLHFRAVDAADPDVARLKAKPLGLSEQGDEGKAFAIAIQNVLAK